MRHERYRGSMLGAGLGLLALLVVVGIMLYLASEIVDVYYGQTGVGTQVNEKNDEVSQAREQRQNQQDSGQAGQPAESDEQDIADEQAQQDPAGQDTSDTSDEQAPPSRGPKRIIERLPTKMPSHDGGLLDELD